jgi:hypothetical protein
VDHRVDLRRGLRAYECLTGSCRSRRTRQLIAKMLEETAPVPSSINAEVPAALDALVMAAIAKDPAGRPQTALALHDRLARIG